MPKFWPKWLRSDDFPGEIIKSWSSTCDSPRLQAWRLINSAPKAPRAGPCRAGPDSYAVQRTECACPSKVSLGVPLEAVQLRDPSHLSAQTQPKLAICSNLIKLRAIASDRKPLGQISNGHFSDQNRPKMVIGSKSAPRTESAIFRSGNSKNVNPLFTRQILAILRPKWSCPQMAGTLQNESFSSRNDSFCRQTGGSGKYHQNRPCKGRFWAHLGQCKGIGPNLGAKMYQNGHVDRHCEADEGARPLAHLAVVEPKIRSDPLHFDNFGPNLCTFCAQIF